MGRSCPRGAEVGMEAAVTRRGWREDGGESWEMRPNIHWRGLKHQAQGVRVL